MATSQTKDQQTKFQAGLNSPASVTSLESQAAASLTFSLLVIPITLNTDSVITNPWQSYIGG